jgi:hypothetical protein
MEDPPVLVSGAKRLTKLAKRAAKAASKKEFRKLERISRRKKPEECSPSIELVVQQENPVQERHRLEGCADVHIFVYSYSSLQFPCIICTHKYSARYPIRIG